MTRPLRIISSGAYYHVMNRGLGRQAVCRTSRDYGLFLRTLEEVVSRYEVWVVAYCMMNNHYHLLIKTMQPNLSEAMKHLGHVYTQRFNRAHDRDGALFRGRFKSLLVEEERYFREVIRYIHLNPVRAKLVAKASEYPMSSHCQLILPPSDVRGLNWYRREDVWKLFQATHDESIDENYRNYLVYMQDAEDFALAEFYEKKRLPPRLNRSEVICSMENSYQRKFYVNRSAPNIEDEKMKPGTFQA